MSCWKIKLCGYLELISGFVGFGFVEKFLPGGENFWAELGKALGVSRHWANSTVFGAILNLKIAVVINK